MKTREKLVSKLAVIMSVLSLMALLMVRPLSVRGDHAGPAFLLKWGSDGTGIGQFISPTGVAVDALGDVYVADQGNHRIQKFTSNGEFITTWGSFGSENGQFDLPFGVAVDGSGNVYVADIRNHRIQKFTSSGGFIAAWGSEGSGNGQFQNPYGVAVDGSGNVYVADTSNNRIQKFTSNGGFITKWGTQGGGNGQFQYPFGIAVGVSGDVFVADTLNLRIQKFTSSGGFITTWGTIGLEYGQFYYPEGVAVDGVGNVYVVDSNNARVQKFTGSGDFITAWGRFGTGDGQFYFPSAVAVNDSGNVYVADTGNHRIQKFGGPAFRLTVAGTGSGSGTVTAPDFSCTIVPLKKYLPGECTGDFPSGTSVTLTATPNPGSVFAGWSGDPDCSDGQVTMNADKTCIARFELKRADLALTKDDSPDPVIAGQNIAYTVTVTNNGPDSATSVRLNDAVPANTTFQSITTPSGWNCSTPPINGTGAITCTTANMSVNTMATFKIVVRVNSDTPEGAAIPNRAGVSNSLSDPNSANNSQTVTTAVIRRADLVIKKNGPTEVAAGAQLCYTIQVTNNGPSNAANVTVTDTLPARTDFVSAAGDGWTCNRNGAIVTCTRSSLPVGEAPLITITVRAPAIGDAIRNVSAVGSATTDPETTNNTSAVNTKLSKASHAAIAFNFTPEKEELSIEAEATSREGVLVVDSVNNQVKIFMTNGDGTFKPGPMMLVGQGPVAASVADFNNDGKNDVVTVNILSNDLSFLEGVGDGTFKRRIKTTVVGNKPSAVAVGDFDGDGRLDLAVACLGDNTVQFFQGQGDGTFAAGRIYLVGKAPSAVVAADFNADGELDLAVANYDSSSVTVLLGKGDGTFSAGGEFLVGTGPVAVTVGDFDGDGRLELVTANFKSSDLSMLKNTSDPGRDGLQRFRLIKTLAAGEGPVAVLSGQFLNGMLGIVCANAISGSVWVYPGTTDGAMRAAQRYTVMTAPGSMAFGDYNSDGKLDLSIVDAAGTSLQVLLDSGSGKFKLAR